MRHYLTEISKGDILSDNQSILEWSTDQIANAGVYLASQHPIEIHGLSMLWILCGQL